MNCDHVTHGAPSRPHFLIFGQGRTGSTLLASLLSSHSEIQCDGEILETAIVDPFGHIAACQATSAKPLYGFKVKIYQLTETQRIPPVLFLSTMARMGTRIVFLSRRNVLRQVLSNRLALANRYHFRAGDKPELKPIRVDPTELLEAITRRARYRRDEEEAIGNLPVYRMVYEDDLISPQAQQRSLTSCFAFLGVSDEPISTDLVRGVTGSVSSHIVNYTDVAVALGGTPYKHLLEDPAYD